MVGETILLQAASIPEILFKILLFFAIILLFLSVLVSISIYKIYQLLFGDRHQETRESAMSAVDKSGNILADFFNSPAGQATVALLESFAESDDPVEDSNTYNNSLESSSKSQSTGNRSQTNSKTKPDTTTQHAATTNKDEISVNEYGELE
jgi:hypothetical protein